MTVIAEQRIIDFAGAACGMAAEPPEGQLPPAGNGAHSVEASCLSSTTTECAPDFTGAAILDIEQIVDRILAANRVIERQGQRCPQGDDCERADSAEPCRIYECSQCDFRGCALCIETHEKEPHWSDSDTAREMYGGLNRVIR